MNLSPLRPLRLLKQINISHSTTRSRHALNLPSQPTITSEDGTRTLRVRKDGKRMPLPPVMDEKVNAARMKWELPKPPQNKDELTPFQKELEANPYARALATPIRQCHLTRAMLPAHFLVPFTTKLPDRPTPDSEERLSKAKLVPAITFKPVLGSSYALATDEIVDLLQKKRRWEMLVTDRMQKAVELKTGKKTNKVKQDWELGAENLKDDIRKKLEWVVVRMLKQLVESEETLLVVPLPAEDVRQERIAAILQFTGDDTLGDQFWESEHYRLQELLSAEHLESLRSDLLLKADTTTAALVKHERTSWALMWMHKLQNFLRPAG